VGEARVNVPMICATAVLSLVSAPLAPAMASATKRATSSTVRSEATVLMSKVITRETAKASGDAGGGGDIKGGKVMGTEGNGGLGSGGAVGSAAADGGVGCIEGSVGGRNGG